MRRTDARRVASGAPESHDARGIAGVAVEDGIGRVHVVVGQQAAGVHCTQRKVHCEDSGHLAGCW